MCKTYSLWKCLGCNYYGSNSVLIEFVIAQICIPSLWCTMLKRLVSFFWYHICLLWQLNTMKKHGAVNRYLSYNLSILYLYWFKYVTIQFHSKSGWTTLESIYNLIWILRFVRIYLKYVASQHYTNAANILALIACNNYEYNFIHCVFYNFMYSFILLEHTF